MTIASETNRSGPYACNGVTTRFPYEFRIYDAAHIRVILTKPDGTETTLATGTDYTVSGVGESGGGAIDMVAAYATGHRVTLILNAPFTQEIDLENQGAYFAETIERAIDLQTQMSLQLKEQVARSVVLPVTSSVSVDRLTGAVLALSEIQPQMQTLAPIAGDIAAVAAMAGAVVAAEGHANTATAAAGVATSKATEAAASAAAAQTWNPASYSTTSQIDTKLAGYVPTTRKLKVGAGLSLDGVAGNDATPAEGDLSADRLVKLLFATSAEAAAGVPVGKPVDPAGLAAAIEALSIRGGATVTLSGTASDLTGIPSTAKRITVTGVGLSGSGTSHILLQLGTSGGIENSGYDAEGGIHANTNDVAAAAFTTGFLLGWSGGAAVRSTQTLSLVKHTGNIWVAELSGGLNNGGGAYYVLGGGGSKVLGGVLDRLRITTVNGTDTFDAGTISILLE